MAHGADPVRQSKPARSDEPDARVDKADGRSERAASQRQRRREAVLASARRVFAAKGFHQTSVSDIIEHAGIARGTFYLYFVSKRAIFEELLDEFFQLLTENVRAVDVTPGARPPMEQMHETVRHVLQTLLANRDLVRILLRQAVGLDSDFDRKLGDFWGRVLEVVEHAVTAGQELGLVRKCNARVASLCTLGSVRELVYHLLVQADMGDLIDPDAITRELLEFNLNGLFVRPAARSSAQ